MTLLELSVEYRDHARALDFRIVQLRDAWEHTMDDRWKDGLRILQRRG